MLSTMSQLFIKKFPFGYDLTDAKTFTKCVIAVSKTKNTFW